MLFIIKKRIILKQFLKLTMSWTVLGAVLPADQGT